MWDPLLGRRRLWGLARLAISDRWFPSNFAALLARFCIAKAPAFVTMRPSGERENELSFRCSRT